MGFARHPNFSIDLRNNLVLQRFFCFEQNGRIIWALHKCSKNFILTYQRFRGAINSKIHNKNCFFITF